MPEKIVFVLIAFFLGVLAVQPSLRRQRPSGEQLRARRVASFKLAVSREDSSSPVGLILVCSRNRTCHASESRHAPLASGTVHYPSLAVGGAALVVLVLGKMFLKNKPVALMVVVAGIRLPAVEGDAAVRK